MTLPSDKLPAHRPRAIRSYVLRAGRITAGQRRALDDLWPRFGIDEGAAPIDLDASFGRRAPRVVEIGFGDGEHLAQMAASDPATDYLGIEVHEPGIGHCLLLVSQLGLTNVRIVRQDAVEVLGQRLPDASLAGVHLLFPDPWPKKRHHKRRIVQPAFARLVAAKLQSGGFLHVATDWAPYGEHVEVVMAGAAELAPVACESTERLASKFERRGERLGHDVFERWWRRSTR
jgi:tRNA (guanine-N7-)-methyltransferase